MRCDNLQLESERYQAVCAFPGLCTRFTVEAPESCAAATAIFELEATAFFELEATAAAGPADGEAGELGALSNITGAAGLELSTSLMKGKQR